MLISIILTYINVLLLHLKNIRIQHLIIYVNDNLKKIIPSYLLHFVTVFRLSVQFVCVFQWTDRSFAVKGMYIWYIPSRTDIIVCNDHCSHLYCFVCYWLLRGKHLTSSHVTLDWPSRATNRSG